jgi:hypothetical protein
MRTKTSVSVAEECVRPERPRAKPIRGKILLATLVGAALISSSGCSGSATIDGTVNYGGGPVAYGSIAFEPKDTHQKKVVATIDEGKFQANDVAKGPSVIRICVGERPAGKTGSLINSTARRHG